MTWESNFWLLTLARCLVCGVIGFALGLIAGMGWLAWG